jgi:MFS family permease
LVGYIGAILWLVMAVFSFVFPSVAPPKTGQSISVRQRLGLDALSLLRDSDHRGVFLTAALLTIPLAAFYPYTPPHLQDLGFSKPSGWMALAQTTEVVAMFMVGALLARWRLKWVLSAGLACAFSRYIACALDEPIWLLIGISLHGATYTLFFTTAQIYVNERMDPAWRVRAQALLTFMVGGVGHLIGYLACGWWYRLNTTDAGTNWTRFWGVLALAIGVVAVNFLMTYKGRLNRPSQAASPSST